MSGNRFRDSMLLAAGASSFVIALVHLAIMFIGAPAYRWFGAPSLAVEVERGSIVPAVLCIVVAAILSLWGLYALAGAGRIKALPLVRTALFVIGTIYLLRGLLAVPQIVSIVSGQDVAPLRYLGFSLVSGITGVLYLGGLMSFSRGTRAHNLKSIPLRTARCDRLAPLPADERCARVARRCPAADRPAGGRPCLSRTQVR